MSKLAAQNFSDKDNIDIVRIKAKKINSNQPGRKVIKFNDK